MKLCPNKCEGGCFYTTAVEVHDWLVDANGEFVEDRGCTEIYAAPDSGNIWQCAECGADAVDSDEVKIIKTTEGYMAQMPDGGYLSDVQGNNCFATMGEAASVAGVQS